MKIEDRAPKVDITSGEDRLAPAGRATRRRAEAAKPASEAGNCRAEAEAEARIADCGKIIDDKEKTAEARAEALTLRGQAYGEKKEWDRALADLTAAIALLPKDGAAPQRSRPVYLARAAAYLGKGDARDARGRLHGRRSAPTPSNGAALLGRACAWAAAGSLANAEADLKTRRGPHARPARRRLQRGARGAARQAAKPPAKRKK